MAKFEFVQESIITQLNAMLGWAIRAQQNYSKNRKSANDDLKKIYRQARRRVYRRIKKSDIPDEEYLIKSLASIEEPAQKLWKRKLEERDIDFNFASLIYSIQELIKELKKGQIEFRDMSMENEISTMESFASSIKSAKNSYTQLYGRKIVLLRELKEY